VADVVQSLSELVEVAKVNAWVRNDNGSFRFAGQVGHTANEEARLAAMDVDAELAGRHLLSMEEPFFLPREVVAALPPGMGMASGSNPVLVAPTRWGEDGFGALVAQADTPTRVFEPRDFRLARGVADLASLAMGNAHRFADLERAFMQTVEVLANALEAKDEYTSGHARVVAEMAVAVGSRMAMSPDDLRNLELAALFHDIGKIGVGTEVINKPGPLDDDEWEQMRRHPDIGAQILAPVEFLRPVSPMVEASHERWDGEGYPKGLAGEDIPLGARIIAVCDAWHAMTSDRSYRRALPEAEALRRLHEAAGTQFDPIVVRVFVDLHAAGEIHSHP
jgi:HD-GYP domain-containing protein (c-di-GMP phosphodiesterase class II)